MEKPALSKHAFAYLTRHLEQMKENKKEIIKRYFPSLSEESEDFTRFFEDYLLEIEKWIEQAVPSDSDPEDLGIPFAVIGSRVTVHDIKYGETFDCLIVFPEDFLLEGDDVSFLSPIGKGLLLRQVGETVDIDAPAGKFLYRVEAIKLETSE